jgi:sugar/nucleoside kinase (ribokinase family)
MAFVTIGELVVDWLSATAGQSLLESGSYYRCLGGNASNVAVGLSRLGGSVRLLGKLGDDINGQFLTSVLAREGVDVSKIVKDERYPTAQCFCLTGLDGGHSYHNWPRPNAAQMLSCKDFSAADLNGARFLHTTGLSCTHDPRRAAISRAVDIAIELDALVSFDAGFPTGEDTAVRRSFEQMMDSAHVLKVNLPELRFWSQAQLGESACEMARRMFSIYRPIVLVATLGAEGSLVVTDRQLTACPPLAVDSVDEIGAGDGFISGFLYKLWELLGDEASPAGLRKLSRQQLADAGRFGNAVGALVTRRVGAIDGLPAKAEVSMLLSGSVK